MLKKLKELKLKSIIEKHPELPYPESFLGKWSDKTANGLTKCVIEYARLMGAQAERINTTGRPRDDRKVYTDVLGHKRQVGSLTWLKTAGVRGSADVSITYKGKSIKVEVKVGKDRQSDDQKKYQRSIEDAGGIYYITRTFDDFYEFFNSL